jgi:hypothetical protein
MSSALHEAVRARLGRVCAVLTLALASALPAAYAQGLIGALYVTTDPPEAAVYVNGELKGISPCGVPDVGAGDVEVRAEKQGFNATVQTVKVEGDGTTEVALSMPRLTDVGSIAVLVEPPGASVEVDRVPAGRTPAVVLNVRAGTHAVTVNADGFRSAYATVTVAPNQQFVFKSRLELAQAPPAIGAAQDLAALGQLDQEHLPPLSALAEEQAFQPVRQLLNERRYEDALRALDKMAGSPDGAKYARRIGEERRLSRRIQGVVTAAYGQLRKCKGQDYVLSLRKGIRLAGKLVDVGDEYLTVQVGGNDRQISLSSIGAGQVVRLASYELDPAEPSNRMSFAALYAAEGEFDDAYDQLRAAAGEGQDITAVRSYADAEHLWAAAVQKDAADRLRARAAGLSAPQRLTELAGPVPMLVDGYRGKEPPSELAAATRNTGFGLRLLSGPFGPEDAERPGVLLICDPGEGRPVPAYDRQEIQAIVDFVRNGGGLVFVGALRRPPQGNGGKGQVQVQESFAALLRWCGVYVRLDELTVSDEAPQGYPHEYAISFPAAAHAVTYGVRQVVFPIRSPSLAVEDASWALVRTNQFVSSKQAGEASPVMVAARALGEGRVLVLANMPTTNTSPWQDSPLNANDADVMLRNGLLWVSDPVRVRLAGGQ